MKNLVVWLVVTLLVVAGLFSGCGKKDTESTERTENTEKVDTAKE